MSQSLYKLFNFLFSVEIIAYIFKKLKEYIRLGFKIGWQNAYHDIVSVTRRLWFFFLFQLFGALSFVFLSQGKDVLQCLLEDLFGYKLIPVFFLLTAVWFWSFASEFGARILLYLTDSSNDCLSDDRLEFRRKTQKLIPAIQFVFPFFLYILTIITTFVQHYEDDPSINTIFAALLFTFLLNLKWALTFYFGKNRTTNHYFILEKNFQRDIIGRLGNILLQKKELLVKYPDEINASMFEPVQNSNGTDIKLSFRKAFYPLYKWCITYILIVLCLFLLIGVVANETAYYKIGTAAIMAFGFTCWLVSFYTVKIFELTQPFKKKYNFLNLPYTSLLFLWLIIVSYVNNDHPINFKTEKCCAQKPTLTPKQFFYEWYKHHKNFLEKTDSIATPDTSAYLQDGLVCNLDSTRGQRHITKIKVLFINAEGGALRTGSFTSLLLAGIQDANSTFKNKIFAYSTVSGGTFGANLFNVMADETSGRLQDSLLPLYTHYYKSVDFLAPVAAKLFFGDFLNYFIPCYVEKLDREVALETAWRNSWKNYLSSSDNNLLYNDFYSSTRTNGTKPAVFINSTVVETGNRAIISNVKLDTSYFKNVFDLNEMIKDNISYATAISLSARFPLVSPAGKLQLDDSHKVHLVDGGYFDNQGGTTMCELLNSLTFDPKTDSIQIIPYVLQTVFDSHKQVVNKGVSAFNEVSEVVTGIYQTRNGHTVYANTRLKEKILQMGGTYLELPVASTTEEVPNNWILSTYAVTRAHTRVINLLKGKGEVEGNKLVKFLRNSGIRSNITRRKGGYRQNKKR